MTVAIKNALIDEIILVNTLSITTLPINSNELFSSIKENYSNNLVQLTRTVSLVSFYLS